MFLNSISNLKAIDSKSNALIFRALLINNIWIGIGHDKKEHIIDLPINVCNTLEYIYSSETNDYWPVGTPRRHVKLNVKNYNDFGLWQPFKEGLLFKGYISNDKIIPNWKQHQKQAKEEYERNIDKAIKAITNGSRRTDDIPTGEEDLS